MGNHSKIRITHYSLTRERAVYLVRLIANLGYGSRKEVMQMFCQGRITGADNVVLGADDQADPVHIRIDGEALDPPPNVLLMLHKPAGYTCSTRDRGRLVYDLLPPRFRRRSPLLACVGRLDRETSGLLLFTDNGQWLHRMISPRSGLAKVYEVTLAEPLRGDEAALFASGTLHLAGEAKALKPARLEPLGAQHARLTLTEGRYHQVRRMFAAIGNHVDALHRSAVGPLTLDGLARGQWRMLHQNTGDAAVQALFQTLNPS